MYEEAELQVKCSFCQDGYFDDIPEFSGTPNKVKCDHCYGTGFCSRDGCECSI